MATVGGALKTEKITVMIIVIILAVHVYNSLESTLGQTCCIKCEINGLDLAHVLRAMVVLHDEHWLTADTQGGGF